MKISENFHLKEFTDSRTARERGIENDPTEQNIDNIIYLVNNLLQPLRTVYGKPITVTSGYRCTLLNLIVGGNTRSQHLKGEAAYCVCENPKQLLEVLLKSNIVFDQAILYPTFLHLSLKKRGCRNQVIYR